MLKRFFGIGEGVNDIGTCLTPISFIFSMRPLVYNAWMYSEILFGHNFFSVLLLLQIFNLNKEWTKYEHQYSANVRW